MSGVSDYFSDDYFGDEYFPNDYWGVPGDAPTDTYVFFVPIFCEIFEPIEEEIWNGECG